jgi:hypothetical protein
MVYFGGILLIMISNEEQLIRKLMQQHFENRRLLKDAELRREKNRQLRESGEPEIIDPDQLRRDSENLEKIKEALEEFNQMYRELKK